MDKVLQSTFGSNYRGNFQDFVTSYGLSCKDTRAEFGVLENFLRTEFLALCEQSRAFDDVSSFLDGAFTLAADGRADSNLPFLLIEDLVEVGSFELLAGLMAYVDERSNSWSSKLSSSKGNGLILLRAVNLLRRKIVRSQHSDLAGLALLLLSKIFPVNERSGINLKGERNVENNNLKLIRGLVDEELKEFWSFHEFLYATPSKFNDSSAWKYMQKTISHVFGKIEERLKIEAQSPSVSLSHSVDFFCCQYLIGTDNFQLQLVDPSFRLSVLAQTLIFLQDLNSASSDGIAAKIELQLDDAQHAWIGESTKRAFHLISQHARGKEYFRFLRFVFRNERNWINWKLHGCPNFDKPPSTDISSKVSPVTEMQEIEPAGLGNPELRRLWAYSAQSVKDRRLKPDVKDYLSQSSESTDPNLLWRANRLKWKTTL